MTERYESLDPEMLKLLIIRPDEAGNVRDSSGQLFAVSKASNKQRERFTEADDQLLLEWVTRAELQGLRTTGFDIFESLQRMHPRHTSQSWHARWKKHLRSHERPLIVVEAALVAPSTCSDEELLIPDLSPASKSTSQVELVPGRTVKTHIKGPESHPDEKVSGSPKQEAETLRGVDSAAHLPPKLPPLRRGSDHEEVPPSHFRGIQQPLPPSRASHAQQRADSELSLRLVIGVNDRTELKRWLTQDWVIEPYHEYATSVIDPLQSVEDETSELRPHSTHKYLINNAVRAVTEGKSRYVDDTVDKTEWGVDDHDLRFMARLVKNGMQPGRWWDHFTTRGDIETACLVACRVMAWVRYMHRFVRCHKTSSPWQKKTGFFWVAVLSDARSLWTRRGQASDDNGHMQPLTSRQISRGTTSNQPTLPSTTAASGSEHSHQNAASCSDREDDPLKSGPGDAKMGDPKGKMPIGQLNTVPVRVDLGSLIEVPFSTADAAAATKTMQTGFDGDWLDLPSVPDYRARPSDAIKGQIKALTWLSRDTKLQFELQEDRALAVWGVRRDHVASCVSVPQYWRDLNPSTICDSFEPSLVPTDEDPRLSITLADHRTSFVRAATFFRIADKRVLRGVDLDVLLGDGPYVPMEGSHLCHNGLCIVPAHAVFENAIVNSARRACCIAARALRASNFPVPWACRKHEPACLLQLAALTRAEDHYIQISNLRVAKGLPALDPPPRPIQHEYITFEYKLPLSFAQVQPPETAKVSLVEPAEPDVNHQLRSPTFYCIFCSNRRPFKKVVSYWGHIRDKHGLVQRDRRLEEIRDSAKIWREHQDHLRQAGSFPYHEPTEAKLRQIEADNFSWDVVTSWKVYHARER